MPRADQADRRSGLRPTKCGAKSKQSQQQCKRWATVGTVPPRCKIHGGGKGVVKDKADLTVTAAQLGLLGLPPAQTISIVQRVLSEQMLRAAGALAAAAEEGRPADPAENTAFVEASDRALVAARVALSAGVEQQSEEEREELAALVVTAVSTTVDAVMWALPGGLKHWHELRDFALAMTAWALSPESDRGERPALPADPEPHLLPGYVHPTSARAGERPGVAAFGELMPAPRRRGAPDADEIWSAAQEIADAEIVEDDDDDAVADAG